jgi:hypothetical protein
MTFYLSVVFDNLSIAALQGFLKDVLVFSPRNATPCLSLSQILDNGAAQWQLFRSGVLLELGVVIRL